MLMHSANHIFGKLFLECQILCISFFPTRSSPSRKALIRNRRNHLNRRSIGILLSKGRIFRGWKREEDDRKRAVQVIDGALSKIGIVIIAGMNPEIGGVQFWFFLLSSETCVQRQMCSRGRYLAKLFLKRQSFAYTRRQKSREGVMCSGVADDVLS